MNCSEFDEILPDLIAGEIAPDAETAARAHASTCSDCGARLSSLERTRDALEETLRGDLAPAEPPVFATRSGGGWVRTLLRVAALLFVFGIGFLTRAALEPSVAVRSETSPTADEAPRPVVEEALPEDVPEHVARTVRRHPNANGLGLSLLSVARR